MKFLVLLAIVGFAAAQINIQVPVRPPQPQQPPQQQPQWPAFPQQPPRAPVAPRASWRDGVFDSRCPNPDDHEGLAFFLPGNSQVDFFICWGTRACKLNKFQLKIIKKFQHFFFFLNFQGHSSAHQTQSGGTIRELVPSQHNSHKESAHSVKMAKKNKLLKILSES